MKNREEGLTPIYRIRHMYMCFICRFILKRTFKINRICGDAAFYEVILISFTQMGFACFFMFFFITKYDER